MQEALTGVYGTSRRVFIYRMVTAAQTLPDAVLDALASAHVPNSYVFDNKFFVGTGADLPRRLSEDNRTRVVSIFEEASGSPYGVALFVTHRPSAAAASVSTGSTGCGCSGRSLREALGAAIVVAFGGRPGLA